VKEIAGATDETFVFFNNHYGGKAAINASMFAEMLGLTGVGDGAPPPTLPLGET
jgi:uncharacterized protein YecE (DUF72 family)